MAFESGRLQLDITQYRNKIAAVHKEIGRHVAKGFADGAAQIPSNDPLIVKKLAEIRFFEEKIVELKAKSTELFNEAKKSE